MLFQTFWIWLTSRLSAYISIHAAATAAAIEPIAVTAAAIYVMVWGYLHLQGKVEQPVLEGAARILTIIVVFGVGLRLWLYHGLIVDTFFAAPADLAARLVGASSPVTMIDTIWDRGGTIAGILWDRAGVLNGELGFYAAAIAVYLLIGFVCVYTMFLMALSRIALAVLLALGPMFIVLTLFDATRRFFQAWLQELANYALVTIITMMVSVLMLDLVETYATQTAARGTSILTVDALNLTLAAGLVLLVLRQVMPIAARLAGGVSLVTFGSVESISQRASGFVGRAALAVSSNVAEAWTGTPEYRAPAWRSTGISGRGSSQ